MEYNDGITFNRSIKRPVVDKIQNGSDCPCYGAAAAVLQQPPAAGRQENRRSNELNWFQGRIPWSLPRRGRHVVTTLVSTKPSQFQVGRNYKIFALQTRDLSQSRDQAAVGSQSPVVRVE